LKKLLPFQTSTAFRMAGNQKSGSDPDFPAAPASALPVNLSVPGFRAANHNQLPELLPDQIHYIRMPAAAAAFFIALRKLSAGSQTFLPTVALTAPDDTTVSPALISGFDTDQPAKPHSCQILLPRLYL